MTRQLIATGLIFAATIETTTAHPGHGSAANQTGLMHYLTSPMHLGSVVLFVIAAIAIRKIWNAIRNQSDSAE